MKLRKLLLGGFTTTLATAPIVANITTTNTLNNVSQMAEETFNHSSNEEAKIEADSSIDCKFSMVETRAYDGHGDVENFYKDGVPFSKTFSGWNGSRKGYKQPTFDEKSNTLGFDTTGHDNVSHLIAQKIKVDITIPANFTNCKFIVGVDGSVRTHAHPDCQGYRVRHTFQLFDLGDDVNTNPERFFDSFAEGYKDQKTEKHCAAEQKIYHAENYNNGGKTYNDEISTRQIKYTLSNNTNNPITVSRYIMISMLTCGDKDKYGDIGSESTFKLHVFKSADYSISLVETRAYDGRNDEDHYEDGLPFKKTLSGWNGGKHGYNTPSFDPNTNTLKFDTTGHDRNSHFIAQKLRVDFTVQPNKNQLKGWKDWKEIGCLSFKGGIKTHIHSSSVDNAYHTIQFFALGDNPNTNPERFDDQWAKYQKTDEHCKHQWGKDGRCLDEHSYLTDDPINLYNEWLCDLPRNNTDKPITVSRYIMISILTCGGAGADVGSESWFQFETDTHVVW